MSVIGIDLKTSKISTALFRTDGEILESKKRPLGELRATQVGRFIRSQIDDFMKKAKDHHVRVRAIGISVPGIFYEKTGIVWAPNIPGWRNYPLLDDLKDYNCPVKVMSDRCCHVLGEHWRGAARSEKNFIYYSVGSGIYAGVMIDGRILRGNSNIAGATGWMGLNDDFRDDYKRCGFLEYHASGTGLAERSVELARKTPDYNGPLLSGNVNAQDVFNAYKNEDPIAMEICRIAVAYWGMSIANLISVFNPSKVILGGSVFGPGTQFKHDIYDEAARWAQPISMQDVTLELSQLGSQAGLIGAGRLALIASKELSG